MCLSDIHCSRCPRSWSAADSPNLCTNLKLRVHQLDNICSSHSKFRFHRCRIDDATGRSLAKKYPKMARFGTSFRGAWGIWPRSGQISQRSHTPMNYKYCLVCACQGMTSPLHSKLPPQISCATGLGVPI